MQQQFETTTVLNHCRDGSSLTRGDDKGLQQTVLLRELEGYDFSSNEGRIVDKEGGPGCPLYYAAESACVDDYLFNDSFQQHEGIYQQKENLALKASPQLYLTCSQWPREETSFLADQAPWYCDYVENQLNYCSSDSMLNLNNFPLYDVGAQHSSRKSLPQIAPAYQLFEFSNQLSQSENPQIKPDSESSRLLMKDTAMTERKDPGEGLSTLREDNQPREHSIKEEASSLFPPCTNIAQGNSIQGKGAISNFLAEAEPSQIDTTLGAVRYWHTQGAAIREEYQKMKPLFLISRESHKRRCIKRKQKHSGKNGFETNSLREPSVSLSQTGENASVKSKKIVKAKIQIKEKKVRKIQRNQFKEDPFLMLRNQVADSSPALRSYLGVENNRKGRSISIYTEGDLINSFSHSHFDQANKRSVQRKGQKAAKKEVGISYVSEKGSTTTDYVSHLNDQNERLPGSLVQKQFQKTCKVQSSRGRPLKERKLEDDLYYYPQQKVEKLKPKSTNIDSAPIEKIKDKVMEDQTLITTVDRELEPKTPLEKSGKWLNKAQIAIPEFRQKKVSLEPAVHQLSDEVFEDDSSDEEFLGDEVYLQRHLKFEIEEIKRYNIGVQDTKNKRAASSAASSQGLSLASARHFMPPAITKDLDFEKPNAGNSGFKMLQKRPREASDISNLRTLADEEEDCSLNPEDNRKEVFNFSSPKEEDNKKQAKRPSSNRLVSGLNEAEKARKHQKRVCTGRHIDTQNFVYH